ncbi:MAG: dTMP kinase [Thermoplasmataceae archaeon]
MFIAIEGIDGSGKTTISLRLASILSDQGIKVFLTKEPTEDLPEAMIRSSFNDALALFFLFMADRSKHEYTISKKLSENYLVISDRFLASSFAYQGPLIEKIFGNFKDTFNWMKMAAEPLKILPDLTFILDIDPFVAMDRIKIREKSPFENPEYLAQVRKYYLATAGSNTVVLNAGLPLEEKLAVMMETINSLYSRK